MTKKKIVKILCIDPGLSSLGWSVLSHNIKKGDTIIKRFGIVQAKKVTTKAAMREETTKYGNRVVSLKYIKEEIRNLMNIHHPDYIVVESAFFCSRFPNAFVALVQVMNTIEMLAYLEYQLPVYKISPKLAKKAIFDSGVAGKSNVIEAVKTTDGLTFQQDRYKDNLNEHEADSVAVGHAFILNILPGLA